MTTPDPHYTVLVTTLHQWDKRWRIQKILIWLPRLLLIPLGFGIALAVFARFSPIFAPHDILIITIVAIVAFMAGFLGWFFLRQRDPLVSARYFDRHFNLQERLSTALELLDGTIHGDAGLVSAQIADAQTHATEFAYKRHLALVIRRLDWAIMVGVCVILAILLILPNPNTQTIQQAQAQQQQIDQSADEVKDLIEDIANDASLDSATREELLQALQVTLETLENPNVSADEALATISDVQSLLEEKSQEAEGRSEAQREALERALEALQNAQNPAESLAEALQNIEEELAEQNAQNEDSSSENQSGEQSGENQSQAESLRDAAEQLRENNPSVAQSLEEAAQALDENDQQAAQEALEQAQEQLAQNPNQQQNEQAAQNLQEAAQQMQEQQQELAQQQQQGQQQEQQQAQNQQGEQQQQGEQNQNENPESNNEGDSNQTGDTQGENPSNSETPSQSESDEISQSDSENQSQQNPQAQGTTLDNNSPTDNLGGDNDADLSQDTSGLTLNEVDQQEGDADTVRGEAQYEAVFAPQRLGGQGDGEEIILAPDINDENLREGDFTDNESGNLTVPYNEVFNSYSRQASTALETGYIPLGLRDVIRQYFTSLAPTTSTQTDN